MSKPAAPPVDPDHPDRHLCCQEALEDDFKTIITKAVEAGWGESEATAAIVDLADNHMLSGGANDETARVLNLLKSMT